MGYIAYVGFIPRKYKIFPHYQSAIICREYSNPASSPIATNLRNETTRLLWAPINQHAGQCFPVIGASPASWLQHVTLGHPEASMHPRIGFRTEI